MEFLFRTNDPQEARRYFEMKTNFTTGPIEVNDALEHGRKVGVDFNVIDVRAAEDFTEGHIPGATSLPEDRWTSLEGLARDKVNLIYCYSGECHLAARAAVGFARAGYSVMEIDGGFKAWSENELPTESGAPAPTAASSGGLKRPENTNFDLDDRFLNESML